MKLFGKWLLGVLAGVVLVTTALVLDTFGGKAQAQESSCEERVPWVSLTGSAVAEGADGDGADVAPALFGAPVTVAAGGAGVSVATAAAAVVAAPAAFLAASMATCTGLDLTIDGKSIGGFIDAILGDAKVLPSTVPTYSITLGEQAPCSGYTPTYGGEINSGASMTYECRSVTLPLVTGSGLLWYANMGLSSPLVRSDNVMLPYPKSGIAPAYRVDDTCTTTLACRSDPYAVTGDGMAGMVPAASATAGPGACWTSNPSNCTQYCKLGPSYSGDPCPSSQWPLTDGYLPMVMRYRCVNDVGGECGMPPGIVSGLTTTSSASLFRAFFNWWPEVNQHGWRRRWVVDLDCRNATGTGHGWIRVESATFQDTTPNQRIPVPQCGAGKVPIGYRVSRVPTGIDCGTPGASACQAKYVVTSWDAPASWANSATAPAWTTCYAAGATCGAPEESGGVCSYGGVAVASGFCNPTQQTDPSETVKPTMEIVPEGDLGPARGELIDQADLDPDGDPPDDGGGGGTTVNVRVPIDDGGEDSNSLAPGLRADNEECWPNGWGWFNPVTWVRDPIICAAKYLVVPEDFGGWIDDQRDQLEDEAPISFAVDGFALVTHAADAPASVKCFGALDGGALESGNVCASLSASGLSTTSDQRQVILAVMIGITVLLGLISFVWMLS